MVPGEGSPTPPGDESEAIDCQPLVCVSPVDDSQLAEATAGVLCPVVDFPEVVQEAEVEEFIDEDGAIVFEGVAAEWREARLPAGVPIPSREMVRRHRAAGHCPYKPWCAHCVSNACNAPSHPAKSVPIGDTP